MNKDTEEKKEEAKPFKAQKKKEAKPIEKAKYHFVRKWETSKKTYEKGSPYHEAHKNITDFLKLKRYIK